MRTRVIFLGNTSKSRGSLFEGQQKGKFLFQSLKIHDLYIEALKRAYDVFSVSVPLTGDFFSSKKLIVRGAHKDNVFYAGYINLFGVKNITEQVSLNSIFKKYLLKSVYGKTIIVCSSAHYPFLKIALRYQKLIPNTKTIMIVPDLPEYMSFVKRSKLYYALKSIESKKIYNAANNINGFIFFTEQMIDRFKAKNLPHKIIEGISRGMKENSLGKYTLPKKIVYAGGINYSFGIESLINAFKKTASSKSALLFCGLGDAVELVKKASETNKNIQYLGLLYGEQFENLMSQAYCFVNPRKNTGDFTKYSFPSKIISYMEYGKPIISYKLDGAKKEYDDLLFYPDDESEDALIKCIDNVLGLNKLTLSKVHRKSAELISKLQLTRFVNDFQEIDSLIFNK